MRRDHLYIMQSADGFLKIGRSKHPQVRRRSLQSERRCAIALVLRVANRGCDEQATLRAMAAFSAGGEWLRDTTEARAALQALFGDALKFRTKMPRWRKPRRISPDKALATWVEDTRLRRHPWDRINTQAAAIAREAAADIIGGKERRRAKMAAILDRIIARRPA